LELDPIFILLSDLDAVKPESFNTGTLTRGQPPWKLDVDFSATEQL
jgi:hypothetical protein